MLTLFDGAMPTSSCGVVRRLYLRASIAAAIGMERDADNQRWVNQKQTRAIGGGSGYGAVPFAEDEGAAGCSEPYGGGALKTDGGSRAGFRRDSLAIWQGKERMWGGEMVCWAPTWFDTTLGSCTRAVAHTHAFRDSEKNLRGNLEAFPDAGLA